MEHVFLQQNFLYSCVHEKKRSNEQFVHDHAFCYLLKGETHLYTSEGTVAFTEGAMGIIKRNQLIKAIKVPSAQGEYKSFNVIFDQAFLHRFAAENNIKTETHYKGSPLLEIKPNPFIQAYVGSLLPYFHQPEQMTAAIGELKLREAIQLLLAHQPGIEQILFDFNEPFKIDLEAYMHRHYTYHVSMSQFARLTGRSLATFKRDFQKIFNDSPERWLQKKRLEHAHFLLEKKSQSPGEVYLEAGFENFSHFSTAFKKQYGYSPSAIGK